MDEEEQALRQLTEHASEALAVALERRGLSPHARGEWLYLGLGQLQARCFVAGVHADRDPVLAFLAFEVLPFVDQEEGIRENVIGVGRTAPEAVEHAVEVCLEGLLPPLASALAPGSTVARLEPALLEQPDLESGGTFEWTVFAGATLATGAPLTTVQISSGLEAPFEVLRRRDALPVFPRNLPLVWMKFLVVRQDGDVSGECRVNNAHWPVGLDTLARSAWPARARQALLRDGDDDGYFAVRQFVVLVPRRR
jgi:hypothetical protein